eukprot:4354476-Ditylum_brightwellii.AAC.1
MSEDNNITLSDPIDRAEVLPEEAGTEEESENNCNPSMEYIELSPDKIAAVFMWLMTILAPSAAVYGM